MECQESCNTPALTDSGISADLQEDLIETDSIRAGHFGHFVLMVQTLLFQFIDLADAFIVNSYRLGRAVASCKPLPSIHRKSQEKVKIRHSQGCHGNGSQGSERMMMQQQLLSAVMDSSMCVSEHACNVSHCFRQCTYSKGSHIVSKTTLNLDSLQ
ncbi:hypothetical protein E1301_Tti000656 [Triplophysa tibetana]|uniref:Uncharacterized protein n=1 Tax=Triplophysa tibetana TaxID=1572043 RepID=A0A5A9N574_9TELE|nr:hypothetical protein E1301_Tti000656 [Triplophysa tibetana]